MMLDCRVGHGNDILGNVGAKPHSSGFNPGMTMRIRVVAMEDSDGNRVGDSR